MGEEELPSQDVGVIICKCGKNIPDKIDLERLTGSLRSDPRVSSVSILDMACSEGSREEVKSTIREGRSKRLVFAGCSPSFKGLYLQDLVQEAGVNRYLLEIANIREQVAWVHSDKDKATDKAIKLTKMAVEKVITDEALLPKTLSLNKSVLVIGGGISGIQAALTIADKGMEAIIVEKNATLGGNLASLAKVAPDMECSACILMGKARDLPNVQVYTSSDILDIKGRYGNFTVKIKKTPRYVDEDKCNNCGACSFSCMVSVPNRFERGLTERKAIYLPYPHAYPLSHLVDMENCNKCEECVDVCEEDAIDLNQQEEELELSVGAIVVATGVQVDTKSPKQLGLGEYKRVMDYSQFERLLSESGPSFGEPVDFMTAEPYETIAFIQIPRGKRHNFRVMDTILKQASLYKERVPDGRAIVMCPKPAQAIKEEESSLRKLKKDESFEFMDGKILGVIEKQDQLEIKHIPRGSKEEQMLTVDLAVLFTGIVPVEIPELASKLTLETKDYGYYRERQPNIGISVAGSCAGTNSFEECLREGEKVGLMSLGVLVGDQLIIEPTIAQVDEDLCGGCGVCVPLCPNGALEIKDDVAQIDETLCEGCGTCSAACPSGASSVKNMKATQFYKMIDRSVI